MKSLSSFLKIHLHRPFVDMRKQASGLAELAEEVKLCNPLSGEVFVFCNKRRNLLKAIYWDRNGFAMWSKRLDQDKFPWPRKATEENLELTEEQMTWLLDGIEYWKIERHKELKYKAVL